MLISFMLGQLTSLNFDQRTRVKSAEARLLLQFDPNQNAALTVLFFSLTDQILEISAQRDVSIGYIT